MALAAVLTQTLVPSRHRRPGAGGGAADGRLRRAPAHPQERAAAPESGDHDHAQGRIVLVRGVAGPARSERRDRARRRAAARRSSRRARIAAECHTGVLADCSCGMSAGSGFGDSGTSGVRVLRDARSSCLHGSHLKETNHMQLALIGLGRMGGNMARRLIAGGHEVVVWDRDAGAVDDGRGRWRHRRVIAGRSRSAAHAAARGLDHGACRRADRGDRHGARRRAAARRHHHRRRQQLLQGRRPARARRSQARGIHYVDVGTSGGVWGAERGYCLMIGGEADAVARLDADLPHAGARARQRRALAGLDRAQTTAHEGFLHCGAGGRRTLRQDDPQRHRVRPDAGRTPKASTSCATPRATRCRRIIATTSISARSPSCGAAAASSARGCSISRPSRSTRIRSSSSSSARVADSGEGRWTVAAAIEENVPADVLTTALYVRFRSRQDHTFAEKLLSALRAQFGGHVEPAR